MNAGLLPTLGVFHHNGFDAFPLADDMMEPYRPFIDEKIYEIYKSGRIDVDKNVKKDILDVFYDRITFSALFTSASSLVGMYEKTCERLSFAVIN